MAHHENDCKHKISVVDLNEIKCINHAVKRISFTECGYTFQQYFRNVISDVVGKFFCFVLIFDKFTDLSIEVKKTSCLPFFVPVWSKASRRIALVV